MKQGIYHQLLNQQLQAKIGELEARNYKVDLEPMDKEEADLILSKYVEEVVRKALVFVREDRRRDRKSKHDLIYQIELCNKLIRLIMENLDEEYFEEFQVAETSEVLLSVYSKVNSVYALDDKASPVRPVTSISSSSLFTGSTKEPDLVSELRKEIGSSDRIDMLISFIKWSGLRLIYDDIKAFSAIASHKVRIITTCYMGATDYGAIERLALLDNVEVLISYNTKQTRLHAKSYLFHRDTGFTTAYIGSSNMSKVAMTSGLEWNMKVSEKESLEVVRKFKATFDSYWNSKDFEVFDPYNEEHKSRLKKAIASERNSSVIESDLMPLFDIQPYAYQQEILDRLVAEREIFGKYRNLVIAATGVGKTVIAGFDYKNFAKKCKPARLLFVAHREEILKQSMRTFRTILKDPNFGEYLGGGILPSELDYLFVTIQSLNSKELTSKTTKDFYDFIIVDEFHHAAADSYQALLDYYEPKVLLGLTATPERMDGKNVFKYFDDRIASEMRLAEAVDHKLLVPFHYFCITDDIDLTGLKWSPQGYQVNELTNLYSLHHEKRIRTIIDSMNRYLSSVEDMKAIGFCVSISHAEAMAKSFNSLGIPALAITTDTDKGLRKSVVQKLQTGEIKIVFTIDLYNEGVDIPCLNTVLFLRPTQSLTVFLQQLGRGLRHDEDKECLTVLDYVGQAHEKYDYEQRFRALLHRSNHSVRESIEDEVFSLPRGCHIKLEKIAREYIMTNIKKAIINLRFIRSRLLSFKTETNREVRLGEFLEYHHMSVIDFYGRYGNRSFYTMLQEATNKTIDSSYDIKLIKKYKNLFFVDSKEMILAGIDYFANEGSVFRDKKIEAIYYYSFYDQSPLKSKWKSFEEGLRIIKSDLRHRDEIIDILKYQYKHLEFVSEGQDFNCNTPLEVHSEYTTNQVLAGIGYYNEEKNPEFREGVLHYKSADTDVFFITLNKSEKEFSEATMYKDYPMNARKFHWQSQNKVSSDSATAKRYREHDDKGHDILLFVREMKKKDGFTSPFIFLGKGHYVSDTGSKPVSYVWELECDMPARFLEDQLSLAK